MDGKKKWDVTFFSPTPLPRFHGSQIYAVCVHYGALLEFYVSVLKDNKPL